jgi:hypothetical protein
MEFANYSMARRKDRELGSIILYSKPTAAIGAARASDGIIEHTKSYCEG